jgi:hypothetical protein
VGVGAGGQKSDAQDLDKYAGKIIRLTPQGQAVPDNPFYDAQRPASARSYVYAYGVRNPYDIAWYPGSHIAVVSEVGPGVDRLFRLESGVNYCFADGEGGDEAMKSNALYSWGPGGHHSPTGLAYYDDRYFGLGDGFSLCIGLFGAVHTPTSEDGGKRILRVAFSPSGHLASGMKAAVQYAGARFCAVTDVEADSVGNVYFLDFYGEGDYPHLHDGILYRLVPGPRSSANSSLPRDLPGEDLFVKHACASCHDRHVGPTRKEGPSLANLHDRLLGRLDSPEYDATLKDLIGRSGEYFVQYRPTYEKLLGLREDERVREWFRRHVRDPRFDHPTGKMPSNKFITDEEIERLADFLLED